MQPVEARISCDDRALRDAQRVLAVALHAYVAINEAGHVVAWNPAAVSMFGVPQQPTPPHHTGSRPAGAPAP